VAQHLPDVGTGRDGTLDGMKNMLDMPARRGHMVRWGIGITLAGFVAGGGFAAAAMSGSTASAGGSGTTGTTSTQASTANTQADNAELNALLSASASSTGKTGLGAFRRLRGLGGMYGSFTFRTKTGDRTLAFERGTIESVNHSNVVVRAPDGTTMTWELVSDTVVREKGVKSATSALSDGQLVFVGGPVVSGAEDARLISIRTGGSGSAPATPAPSAPSGPASSSPSGSAKASTSLS
jgi:hypothetical protein